MASDDDDDYDDDEFETPSAGEILNDAFGKNDKYKIEDGDGWVEALTRYLQVDLCIK